MPHNFPKARVILLLALGLAAISFSPILVRFTPETPPFVLASYRTAFSVLFLWPYWFFKREKEVLPESQREKLLVALAGICLGIHFICWIASLYYTSVASASILVAIHPVILILVERWWFKRRFAAAIWAGVFLAFAGSITLGISDSRTVQEFPDPLFGNMLAVIAAVIFAVYLLIGQKIRQKREWVDYVFPVYFFAAVTCVILTVLAGDNLFSISFIGVSVGAGLAFGPQILGHGSMNYAVRYISPTLLSTLVLTEPLFASILAFFLFDELPPAASVIAMSVVLCGIGLTWKREIRKGEGS